MKLGASAQVIVPGVNKPIPATVSLISPALDPGSTTVEIWLRIDNRSGLLRAGTPVHVSITGRTVAHAMKIPISAVLTAQSGGKSVMVIVKGAAQPRPVQLGITDGQDVEVLSGLTPADLVITSGSFGLDPGTPVQVAPAETGSDKSASDAGGN